MKLTESQIQKQCVAWFRVADLILLIPKGGYASLCIEMKTAKGKQSAAQVEFMELARKMRNKYVVCRSFDDFQKEINEYLEL